MREHVLMRILSHRTKKGISTGSDGFISTTTLSFDVGLNTRNLRRILDEAVRAGSAERRYNGPGKPYSYRMKV